MSHEITSVVGKHQGRKRVGRGRGAGSGKTAGRGHKGSHSRAGAGRLSLYEGGQMPLFRRVPKRGFNNKQFASRFEIVNVSQLEAFEDGAQIGVEQLLRAGLVDDLQSKVKILGDGELTKRLLVAAHKFSKTAEQKIVGCGGTATRVGGKETKSVRRKRA